MRRIGRLPRVLWAVALGACGRIGFDGGGLAVEPALGLTTECGVAPAGAALVVGNRGADPIEILDAQADNGFAVDFHPVTLAPGETAQVTVRPPAAVIGTDRAGDVKQGTLTLVTAGGEETVALSAEVVGANIDVETGTGMPLTLTFSGTDCPAPITAQVANTGTLPATVEVGVNQRFILTGFTSGVVTVAAGDAAPITVRPYTSNVCAASENVTFTVTGSVCTATPIVLAGRFDIAGSSTCACS